MGLFKKNKTETVSGFKMITETGNGFYSWNNKLYKSDIIRSLVRPTSRAFGKAEMVHTRTSKDGLQINPEPYIRFLLEEPNQYMTGQVFQEKMCNQLELNNNAFALILRDDNGLPRELFPIDCTSVEAIYDKNGDLFLKFTFTNGKTLKQPYTNIVHLRQDFYNNDLFGSSPKDVLFPVMEVVTTTDQGIVKAIKNSTIIRWILKFKQTLKPEDVDKQVDEFVKRYLDVNSKSGGTMVADPRYEIDQVKPESYVPNAAQMDRAKNRLYNFFNTNEKIVQSSFSEDDWNAFYEAKLEPQLKQYSSELTRKIFSRKERGFGNKIVSESKNLAYASMQTKLGLVSMVDRGAMKPNEWRGIMNMGPIEGGDKPLRRLDTAVVGSEGGSDD